MFLTRLLSEREVRLVVREPLEQVHHLPLWLQLLLAVEMVNTQMEPLVVMAVLVVAVVYITPPVLGLLVKEIMVLVVALALMTLVAEAEALVAQVLLA
jgi:hypothetical protein